MKVAIGVARPNFLILAPACVFIGLAVAIHDTGPVSLLYAVLAFIGGIFAHISVNALNEYDDYKSGLDEHTTRTPFSGGTGTLPTSRDPNKVVIALLTGVISAIIVCGIGIYFFTIWGWPIVFIGLIGMFIIAAYTPIINHLPLFCLLAPGIGFGTLMVIGTYYVLTGTISLAAVLASFIPFFLVSNLLLLNQFPDADADKAFGRRHFPILIGRKASAWIFTAFLASTYLVIIFSVIFGVFPVWCLLGLLTLIFGVPAAMGALLNPDELPKLMPSMTMNVLANIVTPVLVGIGFFIK